MAPKFIVPSAPSEHKSELRKRALEIRRAVPNKEAASAAIFKSVLSLPELRCPSVIFSYIGSRDEVATLAQFDKLQAAGKTIIVPVCVGEALELFRYESKSELVKGSYDLLEPNAAVRSDLSRAVRNDEIDLALVPGLAFDRNGNRLGYGFGYFDRFFAILPPSVIRIGLAFHEQIFDRIPVERHDMPVDLIITETEIIRPDQEKSPQ